MAFSALLVFIFVRRQPNCKLHTSPFEKSHLRETLRPAKVRIFELGEVEECSNTAVLQTMRRDEVENYALSGVMVRLLSPYDTAGPKSQ